MPQPSRSDRREPSSQRNTSERIWMQCILSAAKDLRFLSAHTLKACHPERSAAESKDLQLPFPRSPQHTKKSQHQPPRPSPIMNPGNRPGGAGSHAQASRRDRPTIAADGTRGNAARKDSHAPEGLREPSSHFHIRALT